MMARKKGNSEHLFSGRCGDKVLQVEGFKIGNIFKLPGMKCLQGNRDHVFSRGDHFGIKHGIHMGDGFPELGHSVAKKDHSVILQLFPEGTFIEDNSGDFLNRFQPRGIQTRVYFHTPGIQHGTEEQWWF